MMVEIQNNKCWWEKKVKEKAVKVGMHDFLMRRKQRTWRSSEYPANKRRMPLSV
jgi:hypothetical protein